MIRQGCVRQWDSWNVLCDPILSERCSPISFLGPQRLRPAPLQAQEFPRIDVICISHNHFDHLDLPSVRASPPSALTLAPLLHTALVSVAYGHDSRRRHTSTARLRVYLVSSVCTPHCQRQKPASCMCQGGRDRRGVASTPVFVFGCPCRYL